MLTFRPRPYGPPQPLMVFPHAPARPWFGMMDPGRRAETSEDRHVMAKHKQAGYSFPFEIVPLNVVLFIRFKCLLIGGISLFSI